MNQNSKSSMQIRQEAEAELSYAPTTIKVSIPAERLLYELNVHQIELEMQNEQLQMAQIELLKSHDRLMDYYEFAPVGYITLNEQGLIDKINLTAASLLKVDRSKIIQHRFLSYISMEDRNHWHKNFVNLLSRDNTLTCELVLMSLDGDFIEVHLDCTRLNSYDDRAEVRIVLTDISEIKKYKIILAQHKKLIDTSIDGFWLTDVEGNFLEVNTTFINLTGYQIEEIMKMNINQIEIKEQSYEDIMARMTNIIVKGHDQFETIYRHKDGHDIEIIVSASYISESHNFLGFCRDIGESNKL